MGIITFLVIHANGAENPSAPSTCQSRITRLHSTWDKTPSSRLVILNCTTIPIREERLQEFLLDIEWASKKIMAEHNKIVDETIKTMAKRLNEPEKTLRKKLDELIAPDVPIRDLLIVPRYVIATDFIPKEIRVVDTMDLRALPISKSAIFYITHHALNQQRFLRRSIFEHELIRDAFRSTINLKCLPCAWFHDIRTLTDITEHELNHIK